MFQCTRRKYIIHSTIWIREIKLDHVAHVFSNMDNKIMDWWIQGIILSPELQAPGKETQAAFVFLWPSPQASSPMFLTPTQTTGISHVPSNPCSCLYSSPLQPSRDISPQQHIHVPPPRYGGLLVWPSESVCFMASKWRLGSATLVPVDAGSLNIASSSLSLSVKWDMWIFLRSSSVLSFLSFLPGAVCWRPTEILLPYSV